MQVAAFGDCYVVVCITLVVCGRSARTTSPRTMRTPRARTTTARHHTPRATQHGEIVTSPRTTGLLRPPPAAQRGDRRPELGVVHSMRKVAYIGLAPPILTNRSDGRTTTARLLRGPPPATPLSHDTRRILAAAAISTTPGENAPPFFGCPAGDPRSSSRNLSPNRRAGATICWPRGASPVLHRMCGI